MTKEEKITALRKKFREQFCVEVGPHPKIGYGYLKPNATPQMVEDFWLHEMGLLED